jgi:hypothetical protein
MLMSYTLFVYSLAAISSDEVAFAGGLLGIALGMVPAVFFVAAFVSMNPKTIRAGVLSTAVWMITTVLFSLVNVPIGLTAGFGAGGVLAFRRDDQHTWQSRLGAVVGCVVYVYALQRVSPVLGLFGGAPLPFVAIALADIFKERSPAVTV